MPICPHCNQEGISTSKKFMVLFINPSCSKICGKPSSIKSVYNWLASFAIVGSFLLLSPFSALDKGNWNNLLFFIILVIGLNFILFKFFPLVALDEKKARRTKTNYRIIQMAIIAVIIAVYFVGI